MSASRLRRAVIALALGATMLTAALVARAEPAPVAPPDPPATAPAPGTPLGVRPTRPIELAEEAPRSAVAWKLGAVAFVGTLAFYAWKQRSSSSTPVSVPNLRIVRRTPVGVRSELLLVEMDGQRLLLGVTPSTIQNLYIVPMAEDELAPVAESQAVTVDRPAPLEVRRRVSEVEPSSPRALRSSAADFVEEQARGIRAVAERK